MNDFIHRGEEKKHFVRGIFDAIAPRYDFFNRLFSLGIDLTWRRRLARALPEDLERPILDVATGTGDVGLAIRKARSQTTVVGLDYAFRMTCLTRAKIRERKVERFHVIQGDGENLPFGDNQFAALTIAFGFRNLGHYHRALEEFYRVLIPGGLLLILDFGFPSGTLIAPLYGFYFNTLIPWACSRLLRGDAYRYLPESVRHFPAWEELQEIIRRIGFGNLSRTELTLGIAVLITGEKE